jgi:type II secretory ATPase GspE/PulE/Tfp pilus assembly ATPase PilB-like protein
MEKLTNPVLIIHELLWKAFNEGVTDLHLESSENYLRIRGRQLGKLSVWENYSKDLGKQIINRLKVLCRLETTKESLICESRILETHRLPPAFFRVSFLPSLYGEKIAIRILSRSLPFTSLAELGMPPAIENDLVNIVREGTGLMLIAGATGSGKTTTLYTLLEQSISEELHLMTFEDPIEYVLPKANQIPIHTGISFHQALKSCLRQDPDVILIGEIRDLEVARLAIDYSLSGHLVLSTLHSRNCSEAILRLKEFISSEKEKLSLAMLDQSLKGILSQNMSYQNGKASVNFEWVKTEYRV